jgi:hypothetical protein
MVTFALDLLPENQDAAFTLKSSYVHASQHAQTHLRPVGCAQEPSISVKSCCDHLPRPAPHRSILDNYQHAPPPGRLVKPRATTVAVTYPQENGRDVQRPLHELLCARHEHVQDGHVALGGRLLRHSHVIPTIRFLATAPSNDNSSFKPNVSSPAVHLPRAKNLTSLPKNSMFPLSPLA